MTKRAKPARPLKFLILNYEFPPIGGGGGTGSRFMAKELVRLGHEVEITTAWFRGLAREYRRPGLVLRRLRTIRREAGRCRPPEMVSYMIVAFFHHLLHFWRRPDVIVSYHSIPSGVPALPLSILWRVPHIILFMGGDVPGFLPQDLARLHKITKIPNNLIVWQAKGAYGNSNGLRDMAAKAFPFKDVGVIPGGVDARVFFPPRKGRAGRSQINFLFVGRFTNQKGVDTLVRVIHRTMKTRPNVPWKARMVGDGPLLETIQSMVAELGLADHFEFPGWLDRQQMLAEYQRADVLTFPSRFEGMSNVVLEAISCGLPILSTRIAGTDELVEDGVNGFLTAVDDIDALSDRLGQLVDDEPLRLRMGEASRRLVLEKWSWTQRAQQLVDATREAQKAYR